MTTKTIEVKASSLTEARKQLRSQIPSDLFLLSETVVSRAERRTLRSIGESIEAALKKAEKKLPEGAHVTKREVLIDCGRKVISVKGPDEDSARLQLQQELDKAARIEAVTLQRHGKRGLLAIGGRQNTYDVSVFQQAVVAVGYKKNAKLRAEIGEWKVKVTCPHCQEPIESRSGLLGKTAKCPECGLSFLLPRVDKKMSPGQALCEHCLRPTLDGCCVNPSRLARAANLGFNPFRDVSPFVPGSDLDIFASLLKNTGDDKNLFKGFFKDSFKRWKERVRHEEGPEWQEKRGKEVSPAWYLCHKCTNTLEQFLRPHEPTTAQSPRPRISGLCDICTKPADEREGRVYSWREMRLAVKHGFNPFLSTLSSGSDLDGKRVSPTSRLMKMGGAEGRF